MPYLKRTFIETIVYLAVLLLAICHNGAIAQTTGWEFQSLRAEVDPRYWVSNEVLFRGSPTMVLSGDNKEYANGSWTRTYEVVPERFYQFTSFFKTENVAQVDRTVLAQLTWLSAEGRRIAFIEFPGTKSLDTGEWKKIQQVYKVPDGAVQAKIDLIYRWDRKGVVYFGGTSLEESEAIKPRLVKLAAIHHRPRSTASSKENLGQFQKFITQAGKQKADIVCLPEGITLVGTGKTYLESSETIPGPTTQFLGQLAKEHQMYIVAGLIEREGGVIYNTSVLMGRNGELVGKYRKVSLPREEIEGGITPGDNFPVFETDFGKIGMMICWDVFFPEAARMLAFKGAEIIFMPIWGGDLTLSKARAIENQVYLVSSTYDMKTGVFDKTGSMMVEGTKKNPVAIVEVDLNQRELWEWLGEFKNRIQREMPSVQAINY